MEQNLTDILTEEQIRLYNILGVGIEQAKFQSEITKLTGISLRHIVALVQDMREKGIPVCSTTKYGYWIAKDPMEITTCVNALQSKIDTLTRTRDALLNL